MHEGFDPYRKWLGIRAAERPLNHYQLLGLEPFEDDPETISHAADQRIAYVRTLAISDYADLTQRVLNELAAAKVCLLIPDKKAAYDRHLRAGEAAAAPPRAVLPPQSTVSPRRPTVAPPAPSARAPAPAPIVPPRPAADFDPLPLPLMPDLPPLMSGVAAGRIRPLPSTTRSPKRGPTPRSSARPLLPWAAMAGLLAVIVLVAVGAMSVLRNQGDGKVVKSDPGQIDPQPPSPVPKPTSEPPTPAVPPPENLAPTVKNVSAVEQRSVDVKPAVPALAIAPFPAEEASKHQEAWANYLKLPGIVTNSIGMKLASIPPGVFQIGAADGEAGASSYEKSRVKRIITQPFYLGVYEVTQREYQNVMGNNPSYFSPGGAGKDQMRDLDTNQFPVDSVSWDDANEFCRKLSAMAAENTAVRIYLLPTESQWEYACRAGTATPFHFGVQCNGAEANCDGHLPYGTSAKGPYLGRPTTVGSYPPNPFGLRDMHGNVSEWCLDWGGEYGDSVDGAFDSVGAKTGPYRVYRGGGWGYDSANCRSAYRGRLQPVDRSFILGFRVALVPSSRASE